MLAISLISWWYSAGWLSAAQRAGARLQAVVRLFSIPLLLKSLFSPFRQISAGRVQGPLNVQFRAWTDRLFSRIIGAIVRLILIIAGVVSLIFVGVVALAVLLIWPLLPLAPIIALFFTTWRGPA